MKLLCSGLFVAVALLGKQGDVQAQHHHHEHYAPRYHVDHHDHAVRDSHGHVIGKYHHDVIHRNASFVVPHVDTAHHHGSFYVNEGTHYYHPQTASSDPRVYAAARPVPIQFGGFAYVEDLGGRLETMANEFCLDLYYNYSQNPGFDETYREAYQLLDVARFIHAAEHQNDRQAVSAKLSGVDQLFHHVQDDVRGWTRHHHRQIGQLGILSKMDMLESTIHHLMNDAGVHHADAGEQAPPPQGAAGVEQAPPPAPAPGNEVISSPPPPM